MPQRKHHKSCSMQRRSQFYPPMKYKILLVGFAEAEDISESKAITNIIKDYFSRLPEHAQQVYLNYGKEVLQGGKNEAI